MRLLILSACAAVLAALALPAAASALIQIDRGIAGARLGNTPAQVQRALGRPARARTGRNEFGRYREETYAGGIRVFYQGGGGVTSVVTSGLGDRTARGIGVGSTESQVRARVRGVRCDAVSGFRSCHTNDFRPGRRLTDFALRNGRVMRVTVGIVVD